RAARRTPDVRTRKRPRQPARRDPATRRPDRRSAVTTHFPDARLEPPSELPTDQPFDQPVRVVLVDDQRLLREGLKTLLELYPDLTVVGEAGDGLEAEALVEQVR